MKFTKIAMGIGVLALAGMLFAASQAMAVEYAVTIELHNNMYYSLVGPNGIIGQANTNQTPRTENLQPGLYSISIPYGSSPQFEVESNGSLISFDKDLKIDGSTVKVMNNKQVTINWTNPISSYTIYGIVSGTISNQVYQSNSYMSETYKLAVSYGPVIQFSLTEANHPDAAVDKKDIIFNNTRSIKLTLSQIPSQGYWFGGYTSIIYNTQTNVHNNFLSGKVLLKISYEPNVQFTLNSDNTLTPDSNSPTPLTQIDANTLQGTTTGGITVTLTTDI